jgi:hypothetical protein
LARRFVKDQGEEIKTYYAVEPLGEIVKQSGKIAVRRNCLGNFQQRPILINRRILSATCTYVHASEHNIALGQGSRQGSAQNGPS